MRVKAGFILWLLFFSFAVMSASAETFYVSADGNDKWSGLLNHPNKEKTDGPFASLAGARDAIRRRKTQKPLTEPVRVIISEGTYTLTEPFVLNSSDSGTKDYPIVYEAAKGAHPVFTGGREITGFKRGDKEIWQTHIPEVASGKWYFEQLYVSGRRAVRARTPNKFYYYMGTTSEVPIDETKNLYRRTTTIRQDALDALKNLGSREINDVTLVAYHKWCITKRFLKGIDPAAKTIITIGEKLKDYSGWEPNTRFHLENFKNALDVPGEWFLARDGTLYYKPTVWDDFFKDQIVAPVVKKFVIFDGKPEKGEFVEHIKIKGLTFHHSQSLLSPAGYEPLQAAYTTEAALMADGARNIVIEDCEIGHTGEYAVWFRRGCRDCTLEHCFLHDLGCGGVRIGEGVIPPDEPSRTSRIKIDNNIIHTGGRINAEAVGIWVGQSGDNTITHNDIGDFFYTGISVGWRWGYAESLSKRNIISFNRVHHLGWGVLSDMGGIYTLGPSEGTIISNNIFHDIYSYSYGGWGLYTDEGSTGIVMENNLVYNTRTGSFHQHYGKENIIRNNIFAFSEQHQLQATRVEEHLSFNFEKNIVYWKTGPLLAGPWDKIRIKMDNNCFWDTNGKEINFAGMTLQQWRQKGNDVNSIIADPQFVDANNYNFKLKDSSPVFGIGFKPFDYEKAGVYGDKKWIDKSKYGMFFHLEKPLAEPSGPP